MITMTILEMASLVGREGVMKVEGDFYIPVKILDVRERFGRLDYLVEPVHGSGKKWVDAYRVNLTHSEVD